MADIRKMEVEDIVKILTDDKFESHSMFNHSKGQWVQFLMQNVDNDNVLILGRVQDNELQNFSVTIHSGGLTHMLYLSDDVMGDVEYKKAIFGWSKKFVNNATVENMQTWDGV